MYYLSQLTRAPNSAQRSIRAPLPLRRIRKTSLINSSFALASQKEPRNGIHRAAWEATIHSMMTKS
jgi:hypothetical protein